MKFTAEEETFTAGILHVIANYCRWQVTLWSLPLALLLHL